MHGRFDYSLELFDPANARTSEFDIVLNMVKSPTLLSLEAAQQVSDNLNLPSTEKLDWFSQQWQDNQGLILAMAGVLAIGVVFIYYPYWKQKQFNKKHAQAKRGNHWIKAVPVAIKGSSVTDEAQLVKLYVDGEVKLPPIVTATSSSSSSTTTTASATCHSIANGIKNLQIMLVTSMLQGLGSTDTIVSNFKALESRCIYLLGIAANTKYQTQAQSVHSYLSTCIETLVSKPLTEFAEGAGSKRQNTEFLPSLMLIGLRSFLSRVLCCGRFNPRLKTQSDTSVTTAHIRQGRQNIEVLTRLMTLLIWFQKEGSSEISLDLREKIIRVLNKIKAKNPDLENDVIVAKEIANAMLIGTGFIKRFFLAFSSLNPLRILFGNLMGLLYFRVPRAWVIKHVQSYILLQYLQHPQCASTFASVSNAPTALQNVLKNMIAATTGAKAFANHWAQIKLLASQIKNFKYDEANYQFINKTIIYALKNYATIQYSTGNNLFTRVFSWLSTCHRTFRFPFGQPWSSWFYIQLTRNHLATTRAVAIEIILKLFPNANKTATTQRTGAAASGASVAEQAHGLSVDHFDLSNPITIDKKLPLPHDKAYRVNPFTKEVTIPVLARARLQPSVAGTTGRKAGLRRQGSTFAAANPLVQATHAQEESKASLP